MQLFDLPDLPHITSNKQSYKCNDTVVVKLPSELAVGQPMFQLASLEMSKSRGSEWPANVIANQISSYQYENNVMPRMPSSTSLPRNDYSVPSVSNAPALLPTPDVLQTRPTLYQPQFSQAYQLKPSGHKPWPQVKNKYDQKWNRSDTRNRSRFQSNKRSGFRSRPRINEANRRSQHKQIKPRNNYDPNFNDIPEYSTVDNAFQLFPPNQMYEQESFKTFPNTYYNGYRGSYQGQRRY